MDYDLLSVFFGQFSGHDLQNVMTNRIFHDMIGNRKKRGE